MIPNKPLQPSSVLHGHTPDKLHCWLVAIQCKCTLADGYFLPLVANIHPLPSC